MKLNNKGFTFVEILAVIAIIGILSGIAIIGVSKYRENAKNKDYEALAKSSYSAMEEYMMANPYKKEVSLKTLDEGEFLSNRIDPATKSSNCEGSVKVEKVKEGKEGSFEDNKYVVYLCCTNYKKMYTYPDGEVKDIDDLSKCDYVDSNTDDYVIPAPIPGETTYNITYNLNGGTVTGNPDKYSNSMLPFSLKNPTKSGYTFDGWTGSGLSGKTKTVTLAKGTTGDKTYTANWTKNTNPSKKYTCAAGKYLPANKTSCATCTSGNYCPGGTWEKSAKNQGLNPCPKGYKNSKTGSSKISHCYINVSAGKYIKTKNSPTQTGCGKGTFKVAHTVNYGSTSKCDNCPSGYRDGNGTTSENKCIMNVSKNNYVKKAKDSKSTACSNGQLRDAHTVSYGKVSSCSSKTITVTFNCNEGTKSSGTSPVKYTSDKTGQKFNFKCVRTGYETDGWADTAKGKKVYEVNSNVTENWVLKNEPSKTVYAHWNIKSVKCDAGKYLKKAQTSCTKCPANYYCKGGTFNYNKNSDQGINKCSKDAAGYDYSNEGSSLISHCYVNVSENHYVKTAKKSPVSCESGKYKTAHKVNYGKISSCSEKTVSVKFDCNGGTKVSGTTPATFRSNGSGQKFNVQCKRDGYATDGWADTSSGAKKYEINSTVTENWVLKHTPSATVYAHWNKLDIPTCKITAKAADGANGWHVSNTKLTLTITGNATSYGLSTSKKSTNKTKTVTVDKDGSYTYYGYVANNNGSNECSFAIKLDKTDPSCGKAEGAAGKDEWTNKNKTIKLHCKDSTSKCEQSIYEKTYKKSKKTDTVTIKDNAGNSHKCEYNVHVDKIAPVMYTTNGSKKKFEFKPSRRKPISKSTTIDDIKCKAYASNDDDYDEKICKSWYWEYNNVPKYNGEFWWGWDHIDCKDKGGSGCKKEYWAWYHNSDKSSQWCKWNEKIGKTKDVKDGTKAKNCNGKTANYDKKFFAGTDKPTYKHGYAYAVDKAGNESEVFDWYMKASYKK